MKLTLTLALTLALAACGPTGEPTSQTVPKDCRMALIYADKTIGAAGDIIGAISEGNTIKAGNHAEKGSDSLEEYKNYRETCMRHFDYEMKGDSHGQ